MIEIVNIFIKVIGVWTMKEYFSTENPLYSRLSNKNYVNL